WEFSVWVHNTSCDAKKLGKALEAAGQARGVGEQAAHVVPTGAFSGRSPRVQRAVQAAQHALASIPIDLNSAANGFFAKVGHLRTHTNDYLIYLGDTLVIAEANGTVAGTLAAIRLGLKNGTLAF